MNKVELYGRLTADPILRATNTGTQITSFTLAVDRPSINSDIDADFIRCKGFGNRAVNLERWFHKGDPIIIVGHIQTGNYEKNGQKFTSFEVVVDEFHFCSGRQNYSYAPENRQKPQEAAKIGQVDAYTTSDDFEQISAIEDADIPF